MARTKTSPAPAPSAAHAAPDPAPAHDGPAAPGSPAAAVCAALAANPGTTVAVIAAAAGTGKPAARDALLAMEADGTATRVKGSRPGIPDTWTVTGPAPDDASPADPQDGQAGQTGDDPDGSPDDAGEAGTAGAGDAAPDEGDEAGAGISAAPGPDPALENPAPAEAGHEDAVPGEQDDEDDQPGRGASRDPDGHDDTLKEDEVPADPAGEDGDGPDPALVAKISDRVEQIRAAADRAALALDAGGELPAALGSLDEICEQAAQARRDLKAAIGGRKAPAARPGGLREKVLAHLAANPGKDFTPHEIHKVLGNSSGAIANALDTLVKLGQAEVASEKPRRFRLAETAEAAPRADDAGSPAEDGAELAGAA